MCIILGTFSIPFVMPVRPGGERPYTSSHLCPDSKVQGANMGPILGRQDPDGPHVGPMNFANWVTMIQGLQLLKRRHVLLTLRSREISSVWDPVLKWSYHSEIRQSPRQRLRTRLSNFRAIGQLTAMSRGFEFSPDRVLTWTFCRFVLVDRGHVVSY